MESKESLGIKTIQCGRIDFYIPLKFETKYSYNKLCKKINNCLNDSIKKHENTILKDVETICEKLNTVLVSNATNKISISQQVKNFFNRSKNCNKHSVPRENLHNSLELNFKEKEIEVNPHFEESEIYQNRFDELSQEYEKIKELYGSRYSNAQKRYVLLPLHIQLNNDCFVWLNAILYIFENKAGILKLELPLINVSPKPLFDNNYDQFIKKIENPWFIDMNITDFTINGIKKMYITTFLCKRGINVIAQEGRLKNILLSNFDGMPKQINNITLEIQEDLFRIIAAPVSTIGSTSYKQTAREYINEHSWSKHNMKYICSTTGGCLSIVDTALIDWLQNEYKKKWNIENFTEDEIMQIYNSVIRDLCINVEFTLIIILLKQMNAKYFYHMKLSNPHDIHNVQKAYNINRLFIAELQEFCYGTVSEQLKDFEQIMPYYVKENLTSTKMDAIDRIIADEQLQQSSLLQNFLSLGSVLLALFFGLPSIYETVLNVRKICTFITYDIPFLSIENISFCIWLILILVLIIFTISIWNPRNKKHIYKSNKM